jgi:hypothetical protein
MEKKNYKSLYLELKQENEILAMELKNKEREITYLLEELDFQKKSIQEAFGLLVDLDLKSKNFLSKYKEYSGSLDLEIQNFNKKKTK